MEHVELLAKTTVNLKSRTPGDRRADRRRADPQPLDPKARPEPPELNEERVLECSGGAAHTSTGFGPGRRLPKGPTLGRRWLERGQRPFAVSVGEDRTMRRRATERFAGRAVAMVLLVALVGSCGKEEPTDAQLANQALERGLRAHTEGNLTGAVAAYNEVLVYDPQNKFAYYNLGLIDQTEGRAESAEANYRQVLSIDPTYGPALFNLAILRTAAGASQEAVDLYRQVVEIDPSNASAHLNLGFLLLDLGKTSQGEQQLNAAVELDPSLADRISPVPDGGGSQPTGPTGP